LLVSFDHISPFQDSFCELVVMNTGKNDPHLISKIVASYLGHNRLAANELSALVVTVYQAIRQLGQGACARTAPYAGCFNTAFRATRLCCVPGLRLQRAISTAAYRHATWLEQG
jgi:hypothetical protein